MVGAAWASSIALVTFFTLMKPTSGFTAWLDHQYAVYVIWCVVWALGIIPAIFGTVGFQIANNFKSQAVADDVTIRFFSICPTLEVYVGTGIIRSNQN